MSSHGLREGLSFCRMDDGIVFLDRQRDRYFALAPAPAAAFALWLDGSALTHAQMQPLIDLHLLVPDTRSTRDVSPCRRSAPADQALRPADPTAGAKAILEALGRRTLWSWRLRHRSLNDNLLALASHRQRCKGRRAPAQTAGRIVAAYAGAARWVSAYDQCLPTALSMTHWLIAQGLPAELLLGVKLHPFQAHSWVELEGQMLGDDPDHVRPFTPIWVG